MNEFISEKNYLAFSRKCQHYFSNSKGSLLKQFYKPEAVQYDVHDFFHHYNRYEETPSQEKTGYCWLIAALNCISEYVKEKYSIQKVQFQKENLIFYDKLEKANLFLENMLYLLNVPLNSYAVQYCLKNAVTDKGQWAMAENLICKYGLIPYNDTDRHQIPLKTNELNGILNYLLKHAASCIRKMSNTYSMEELREYKENILAEVYQLLISFLGEPVRVFQMPKEYLKDNEPIDVKTTPKKFFQKYIQFPFSEYVSICNYGENDKSDYTNYTIAYDGNVWEGKKNTFFQMPYNKFHEAVFQQIHQHIPVWFSCDAGKFVVQNQKILDDACFVFPLPNNDNLLGQLSRNEIVDYSIACMSHAMTMCDYHEKWWYALNSVGEDFNSGTACCISDSWFEHYVYQAIVKKRFLPREAQSKLDSSKNVEPWEFFLTLFI